MKKEDIHLGDIARIFIGEAPPEFLVEVFIRSLVMYLLALFVVRWMGKRMSGQLTIIEQSVMVMMGAIVSAPMQIPERGLAPGLVVLFSILILLRCVNWLSYKKPAFERQAQGKLVLLVKDGVLLPDAMRSVRLTNQQLFGKLRGRGIYNLGNVKRLYLEACGLISVYQESEAKPGLPLYPQTDRALYNRHPAAPGALKACRCCGAVHSREVLVCTHCGNKQWAKAIQ